MIQHLRFGAAVLVALLPSPLKVFILRKVFRFQIGSGVRIGFSMIAGVKRCSIGNHVRIGHGNAFLYIDELQIGDQSQIGSFNLFRGGRRISLGRFATMRHCNVLNSIRNPDAVNPTNPECLLGDGAVITNSHWLDYTDQISLGSGTILGGRGSSLWTHNRQRTRPISIGDHTYIGSDVRMAPGTFVAGNCIVALGAVLMDRFPESRLLIAGNPASALRPLNERDFSLIARPTRRDIPESLALATLAEDLHSWACQE